MAFLIIKTNLITNETLDIFHKRKMSQAVKYIINDYSFFLFNKSLLNEDQFYEEEKNGIYLSGTLFYKNLDFKAGLMQLLDDFISNKIETTELQGSFTVIIKNIDKYYFFTDLSGLANIYYTSDSSVISDSFLAVTESCNKTLTINKNATTEILTTGMLIGPDTLFNEIFRFEASLGSNLSCLEFKPLMPEIVQEESIKNYSEAIDSQLYHLDKYFLSIKTNGETYGIDSGLTSGFDSRLIMCFLNKHIKNKTYNSHWRNIPTLEFDIAKELCSVSNHELRTHSVTDPHNMTDDELKIQLEKSMLYFDGQIRSNAFWVEEINTFDYRGKILEKSKLAINGVGGEQYRNGERIMWPKIYFSNWFYLEYIYRFSGNCFKSKNAKKDFLNSVLKKVNHKLKKNSNLYNHKEIKQFLNEVYVPANRALRTNCDNNLCYSLSPFTDYLIAQNAYKIIPFLGPSLKFESEMIKKTNPILAKIRSEYGFDFYSGEPLLSVITSILAGIVPKRLFFMVYRLLRGNKSEETYYKKLTKTHPFLIEYEKEVRKLNLPLRLDYILQNDASSPAVIALGYFLTQNKNKIINS